MKSTILIFQLLLYVCILANNGLSQTFKNSTLFDKLTIEQGLSQSSVFSIHQDKYGYMWFGTQDGLNKYDGLKFTIYKHSTKDPKTISDNNIRCIVEDADGNLWIGTMKGGLNKFDREKQQFITYRHSKSNQNSVSQNSISALTLDNKGNLWIGTDEGGLDKLNIKTNKIQHYKFKKDNSKGISSNKISCIYKDKNDVIWIGTRNEGLCKYNASSDNFTQFKNSPFNKLSLPVNSIVSISEDQNKNLLILSVNSLVKFDSQKNLFTTLFSENAVSFSSLLKDQNGNIWISSFGNGLIVLNSNYKKIANYLNNPLDNSSISLNNVPSITIDKSGIMWIGTYGAGINKLNLNDPKFQLYKNEAGKENSLISKSIRAIYVDDSGILWIGGYGGIDKIDRKKSTIEQLTIGNKSDQFHINSSNIFVLEGDKNDPNILWIGYEGGGFSRMNKRDKTFKHYLSSTPWSSDHLSSDFILDAYDDGKGFIWLATMNGISVFNKSNETFKNILHDPKNSNSLSHNEVRTVWEDRQGIFWFGTNGGGLDRYDPKTSKFTNFSYDPDNPFSISNNSIRSIYEDKAGNFWIGTDGGGLNKMDRKSKTFTVYSESEKLPNNVIYSILEDKSGKLWMSTNKGICNFDPISKKVKSYDHKNGLQSNEFNQGAYFKSKSGEIFFGGINGVNSFHPDRLKVNLFEPPIVFTSFKKYNSEFYFPKPIDLIDEIELSYRDRVFSFEFAALDFTSPEKNEYAYKMEGFNDNWIQIGTKHEATYTNLDPGVYTFRVKASNNDGIWNNDGAAIKIIIAPPYWQTWWFIVSSVIFILLLILLFIRLRVRKIKKQNQLLESQVRERTTELKEINQQLEKLSIVASETSSGVLIADANGNLEWFNQGFSKLFGWKSLEEYIEKRGSNITDVTGQENIERLIKKCTETKSSVTYENETPNSKGENLWIKTNLTPIFDKDGKLKKLVFVETDVSELKKAKETAEEALQIQEEFLANTSHEIRTPMNGVIGMTRQLLETPLTEEQTEYLNAIQESSNSLLHVVNDILDISKIRAGKIVFEKTEFRLEDLFRTLQISMSYRADEKDIYLKTEIDSEIPPVLLGDPIRLNQIILNLVGNAIKFTDKGGVIISAQKTKIIDNKIEINFCVSDTGIGIAEDKINFVFESFAQAENHTTRKYGGTGLGLSISKSLVQQQGGHFSVTSKLGEGSSFCFKLLFEIGDPNWKGVSAQMTEGIPENVDLSELRILVVDDNKINQRVATFELKKWKVQTEVVNSAEEAFVKLREKDFDVVLMDISMPGMDGLEATLYIRAEMSEPIKNIPIIAMTASALTGERDKYFAAGMNDFISKPFNPVTLYSKIIKWGKGEKAKLIDKPVSKQNTMTSNKAIDLTLLYEHAHGNMDYIKEMMSIYLKDIPIYLNNLNESFNTKNWIEVKKYAHKMKSPIGLFGAKALQEVLHAIEVHFDGEVNETFLSEQIKKTNTMTNLTLNEVAEELQRLK